VLFTQEQSFGLLDAANREGIKMLSETRVFHFSLVTKCEMLIL